MDPRQCVAISIFGEIEGYETKGDPKWMQTHHVRIGETFKFRVTNKTDFVMKIMLIFEKIVGFYEIDPHSDKIIDADTEQYEYHPDVKPEKSDFKVTEDLLRTAILQVCCHYEFDPPFIRPVTGKDGEITYKPYSKDHHNYFFMLKNIGVRQKKTIYTKQKWFKPSTIHLGYIQKRLKRLTNNTANINGKYTLKHAERMSSSKAAPTTGNYTPNWMISKTTNMKFTPKYV